MIRVTVVLLSIVTLVGCATTPKPMKPDPIQTAGDGLAGVVAHTESAQRHVQNSVPHADGTGKVYLAAAGDELKDALTGTSRVKESLFAEQVRVADLQVANTQQVTAYQKLESRWYVVWGRRIERALWIIGISWLVLGVASVVLGLGNPLGWCSWIGRELVHLLPMMNPFTWVRDWLSQRKVGA